MNEIIKKYLKLTNQKQLQEKIICFVCDKEFETTMETITAFIDGYHLYYCSSDCWLNEKNQI